MRSGDRGEVEIISPCSHDVLLKPDSVLRSRRIPLTKLLNLSCDCRCYTMSSKCEGFSEVPVLAISGVVDTCSISTGDGWTKGTGKGIRGSNHRGCGHMFDLVRVSTTKNRLGETGLG